MGLPHRPSLLNNRTFETLKGIFQQQPHKKPKVEKACLERFVELWFNGVDYTLTYKKFRGIVSA